jgi:phage/plasmid primase-like uncharacterized protein
MRDQYGDIVGLRLRSPNGGKFAVTGSRQGLFYTVDSVRDTTVYIVEGPTDTAAALTIGLCAVVGRPSCSGCLDATLALITRFRFRRVVIVADNDAPGWRGAETLQAALRVPSMIVVPPAKDLRAAVRDGFTAEDLMVMGNAQIWKQPI